MGMLYLTVRELEADEFEAAWDDKLHKLVGAPSKADAIKKKSRKEPSDQ